MRKTRDVYLDYSASTPVDPRVLEAMMPYFSDVYGNPSSTHRYGREADRAIETARETVAAILNCRPAEIIFTSGGSESDNLALRGAAWRARKQGRPAKLITSPVEHSAVSGAVQQLGDVMDFETEIVPVDRYGLIDQAAYAAASADGGAVASVIYANNELGSVNDLPALSRIARASDILFHTDAVQAGGQLTLDVEQLGVDMLSLSAHKFYGPKGVGILYLREGVDLVPTQTGGGHEAGRRAGTHNTPFIVGLAKALQLAYAEREERNARFRRLRDRIIDAVLGRLPAAELSGHPERRLPSHASFVLNGIDVNALLMHLDLKGVAVSSGSACMNGNPEPAESLLAAGYTAEQAKSGLRLSVGLGTTEADIDYALDVLVAAVGKLSRLRREPAP
ncbi:MAG: cysteine desulfurase [Chloroflexi bacterium]|nr:cysteine desulfurase [Chloroflexota bacterium]